MAAGSLRTQWEVTKAKGNVGPDGGGLCRPRAGKQMHFDGRWESPHLGLLSGMKDLRGAVVGSGQEFRLSWEDLFTGQSKPGPPWATMAVFLSHCVPQFAHRKMEIVRLATS